MTVSRDNLLQWCWQAAEVGGLSGLEPSYLARRHRVPLIEIAPFLPNRTYALLLLVDDILREGDMSSSQGGRGDDYLFDAIMVYFDRAHLHHSAIAKLWSDLHWHPLEGITLLPHFTKTINSMVDQAFGEMNWLTQQMTYKAYQLLVGETFLTWLDDSTPDLAKTMAKLDHGLKRLQSCRALFSS